MKNLVAGVGVGIVLLFGGMGLVLLLGFYYSVITGYTLSILWQWFLVPSLGIPNIGIAQAVGISITIRYLTGNHKRSDVEKRADKKEKEIRKEERKDMSNNKKYLHIFKLLIEPLGIAASILLGGWIVHMFI